MIAIDQVTKFLVTTQMEIGDSHRLIPGFLYLTYHRNSGAAFGIMQGQMLLFYGVTAIALILLITWLRRLNLEKEWVMGIALGLLIGGAIGNFIDRVINQAVIDFVHTIWWGRSFAIFNVADMALTVGAVLMMLDVLFLEKRRNSFETIGVVDERVQN